ncbi:MAG: DMT family transporter [Clostridia bacterium]|nr:DMT family transporter [Clostridia bacterium]
MKDKNFFQRQLSLLFCAIIATFLWGSAIPAIKIGYELFNITESGANVKFVFAGIRFVIAGIIVIIFDCITKKRIVVPRKDEIKGIVLLGIVQTTVEYIFFYLSLIYLSGVKGSILNSIGNFFAVILAHFMFNNDKINLKKFMGCMLGFCGVVFCCFEEGLDLSFTFKGDGFILIAAFCFAMGSVITKIVTKKSDSVTVTGWQLTIGGILLTGIGLVFGGRLSFPDMKSVIMLIYLAIISSCAFTIWAQLLKYNPVGKISVYCFLNPCFGVILSGIMLGENIFNVKTIGALVLVCLGIYIVNMPERKKHKQEI